MEKTMNTRCPNCRTCDQLEKKYSLLLSFDQWPAMILFSTIFMLVGNLLALPPDIIAIGWSVSLLPLFFTLLEKNRCERCGLEFRQTEPITPNAGIDLPE